MGTCDDTAENEEKAAFSDGTPDVGMSYAVFQLWVWSRSIDYSVF